MAPPSFGRRLLDSAVRPLNLVAPGLGGLVAGGLVATGLPPLAIAVGAVSIAAWGAMVVFDLATPHREPPKAPPPKLAPHLQEAVEAVRRAGAQVDQGIQRHDGVLSASLAEVSGDCQGLLEAAEGLARRGDAVYRWLQTHDPQAVVAEITQLQRVRQGTRDPEAAATLAGAIGAKQAELQARESIRAIHDRIVAELIATEAALDELAARVIKLTFGDSAELEEGGEGIRAGLAELRAHMGGLERAASATLKEVR